MHFVGGGRLVQILYERYIVHCDSEVPLVLVEERVSLVVLLTRSNQL
jgi:hypothetical protein